MILAMVYLNYELYARSMRPVQRAAAWWAGSMMQLHETHGWDGWRRLSAELEAIGLAELTHSRAPFGITHATDSLGAIDEVLESSVLETAFARLIHFKRASARQVPKVLLVAPMSGHFATLLTGTVRALLQDHEVYLTDWINPRDIPLTSGEFGFAAYVQHVIDFLKHLGPGVHLMGVCQPTVACLAAAALMAQDGDPCEPASLILMAGPIDTRISPTRVNELAQQRPIEWFEKNMISLVPLPYAGAGRRVYPGVVQLTAFMSMNRERHAQAFQNLRTLRADGQDEKAQAIHDFYREYFAVMDLTGEFYLETVEKIFQQHELPRGTLQVHGRRIDCSAIRRPFLLTIEGERDDICGIGQTLAAQDLCKRMPLYKKMHHLQAGVGHYGVFNGKRWERRIYPIVRDFIQSTA